MEHNKKSSCVFNFVTRTRGRTKTRPYDYNKYMKYIKYIEYNKYIKYIT